MSRKVSLLTMSQGNAIVLKETFKSFSIFCDEIVYADLCLFEEDSKLIESYKNEFNLKIIKLPFNYIFHMGFSNILNLLAKNAKNDLTVYMNCSEVIETDNGVTNIIN
jgi:hypothetical protein